MSRKTRNPASLLIFIIDFVENVRHD